MDLDDQFYRSLLENIRDGVYFLDPSRKITYWNRGAERLTGFRPEEVIDCYCREDVLEHTDEKGLRLCDAALCPAAKTLEDGKEREEILYFRHKDGHRVPVQARISPLRDASGTMRGVVHIFSDASSTLANLQTIEELRALSLLDPLTGVGNRRFGEMSLDERLKEMDRYGWPFGALFIDLDDFKAVNDPYGHETGDRLLKMTAATLRGSLRAYDTVSRWGGEEFLVLVINVDQDRLFRVGEKLRLLVAQSGLKTDLGRLTCTVSIGGTLAAPSDTPEGLVARADSLMYRAKAEGKNRVVVS